MEAAEEQTTTTAATSGAADYDDGPTDITNVAKGKRTKRQRPQSPIRFAFSPSNNNDDEDTAESLILLSKGQSLDISITRRNNDDYDGLFKFNSKKYIQFSDTGTGGVFVYECKTCGRTFSSFQALGGHRASHKKPRNNEDTQKAPTPPDYISRMNNDHYSSSSSLSFQLNNRVSLTGKAASRLHECAICGTEFNSGQALGGHMRRHRAAGGRNKGGHHRKEMVNDMNATTLSLIPFSAVTTVGVADPKGKNDALCLGLDLNLPAGESENKQQPAVHLSTAPSMVDCQY